MPLRSTVTLENIEWDGIPHRLAAHLYFGVQKLRRGVSLPQVRECSSLLDSSIVELNAHVERRLRATHGATRPALDWLSLQPLTEREDLDGSCAEIGWLRRFRNLELKKTSGSTGRPVRICKSMEMAARMDATMWAVYGWHGISPGMRHARFWGMPRRGIARMRTRALDLSLRRRRFDAFNVSPESVRRCFHALRGFRPFYVYGYPTLVDEFARLASQQSLDGQELGVRTVVLTGELLRTEVRERIQAYFGARVVNEYGCSESGLLAFECESGSIHLVSGAAFTEVLDPHGRPGRSGTPGEAVVTDLYGDHRPLLRYRLGDRILVEPDERCPCGRSLPIVTLSGGRSNALIQLPNGNQVYAAVLAYSMPNTVVKFQARQLSPDELDVAIQIRDGENPGQVLTACHRELHEALEGKLQIQVRPVNSLPHEPGGKHRYFVPMDRASQRS